MATDLDPNARALLERGTPQAIHLPPHGAGAWIAIQYTSDQFVLIEAAEGGGADPNLVARVATFDEILTHFREAWPSAFRLLKEARRTRQARYIQGRIAYMADPAHVPDEYFAEWAAHLKDSVRRLAQLAREAEPGRGLKDVV